ncbi:MAG: CinA family protein [Anaerolineae bacterium]|nr:CinA family protein [Anaerolineae bacterium]
MRLGGAMGKILEERVGELLVRQGLTLAVAESCTGGLVGHRLTNVPGSSRYFMGGVIAYDNSAKERALGVRRSTLNDYGAVSAATAQELAQGAHRLFDTDIAVSVTGIAGPGGSTPGKPVGLTYIHLSAHETEWGERHVWQGDREANKAQSAEAALDLLRRYLERASAP